ncbi:MAG: hypothetical protein Q9170_002138 [Blastenia crenularia]
MSDINRPAPTSLPRQNCTLYFYTWSCGHRQFVNCSNCNWSKSTDPKAHSEHEHKQVPLPDPEYRCPVCDHAAPHQGQLVNTANLDALAIRRHLDEVRNSAAVKRAKINADVFDKEHPWMTGFDETEEIPDHRLRDKILLNNHQTTLVGERMEDWQRNSFGPDRRDPPSETGSESTAQPPHQHISGSVAPSPDSQQTTSRRPAPRQTPHAPLHSSGPGLPHTLILRIHSGAPPIKVTLDMVLVSNPANTYLTRARLQGLVPRCHSNTTLVVAEVQSLSELAMLINIPTITTRLTHISLLYSRPALLIEVEDATGHLAPISVNRIRMPLSIHIRNSRRLVFLEVVFISIGDALVVAMDVEVFVKGDIMVPEERRRGNAMHAEENHSGEHERRLISNESLVEALKVRSAEEEKVGSIELTTKQCDENGQ